MCVKFCYKFINFYLVFKFLIIWCLVIRLLDFLNAENTCTIRSNDIIGNGRLCWCPLTI